MANSKKLSDLKLAKDKAGIEKFNADNPNHARIKTIVGSTEQKIGDLNSKKHAIELDPSLDDKTRRQKIDEIEQRKAKLQTDALQKLNALE